MSINITQSTTQSNIFEINGIPANNLFNLGWIVKGNGDIDGDGEKDFVILAPGDNGNTGKLYVVYGSSNLATSSTQTIALNSPFSTQVAVSLGDINGDGKDDIIIGDSSADFATAEGKTYVVFGDNSTNIATDVGTLNGTNGFTIVNSDSGLNVPDLLGWSVSAGDIDGDGKDDVIIGDPSAPSGSQDGEVYVVFGNSTFSPVFDISTASATNILKFNAPTSSFAQLGFSVSTGNIGGGTQDDIIIGAPFTTTGGETHVIFGNATRSSIATNPSSLTGSNGFTFKSTTGEFLGWKVGSAGDINGDGFKDLIVTAPLNGTNQRTYVLFGGTSFSSTIDTTTINGTNGFYIDGLNDDDFQFESISAAGDVNQDGIDDFIVAEPLADTGGLADSGQAYVIFGKPGAPSTAPFGTSVNLANLGRNDGFKINISGLAASDNTGFSVSDAGDVNGDGYKDFLIGAPGANGTDGTVYVVLGSPTDQPIPETTVNLNYYPNPLIGENYKFIVTFDNLASSPGNVGYNPFIDLFLDTTGADGDDGFQFVGVKALSSYYLPDDVNGYPTSQTIDFINTLNRSIKTATIYTDSSGHLLVDHPIAGTIDLTTTLPSLPTDIGDGDKLYVIPLLTDSVTPDQQPLNFEVEVKVSNLADYKDPSNPSADTKLTIATRGGFGTGADTKFDIPPIDPIFDNTATDNSIEPQLFRVYKYFSNGFDYSKIITGENFGGTYTIYVDVAPGQTIQTLNLTDDLPDDILYLNAVSIPTGATISYSTPGIPGGIVTAQLGNVTGAAGIDAVLTFDVEIGRFDKVGNEALNPNTADDETANNDAYVTAVSWDPLDTRDPIRSNLTEDQGDIDNSISELALGVRKSYSIVQDNKAAGLSPGDVIEYTLNFAVSDYFAFQNVVINDYFSDGQIFDTSFTPTFTVNEHSTTPLSGNFAGSNYSVVNPGSNGTVTFNLSNQLVTSGSDAKLLGGKIGTSGGYTGTFGATTGTITFRTIIQEDFTTWFPSGDSSVDNGDYLYNTVNITGDVLNVNTLTPNSFNEADSDGVGLYLPRAPYSNYEVTVYAINGTISPSSSIVQAGDQITYRVKYTMLFGGDTEKLNFTSELPFPVFDVSDLDLSGVDPYLGTGWVPAVNQIAYGPNDTVSTFTTLNPTGTVTPILSIDGQSNSLKIDYGTFDDPTTALTPVTVDLLYTLEVGNQPTANNQLLTNLVYQQEGSTNAGSSRYYKIASLQLAQPELNIQKGVVATTDTKAVFSEFFPVVGGNPPPIITNFTAPGSAGTRFSGTINSNLLDTNNYFNSDVTAKLSVATTNNGVQDRVTYAIVVENTGFRDAYDVLLKDVLPTGYTTADVTNFNITNGVGTAITYTGTIADFFGTAGITLNDTSSGAVKAYNATNGNNIVVITYDLEVKDLTPDQTVLTNTAILEEYAASNGGAKFLPGTQKLEEKAEVKTQPYLQVQFEAFRVAFPTGAGGGNVLAGQTFNALNYLGDSNLNYKVVVKKGTLTVYDSTSTVVNPQNPFSAIDVSDLKFTFKPSLGGTLSGNYTVTVDISDADSTNNPVATPLYDVRDSFQVQINSFGTVTNNYIAGATVFFDANKNSILDTGEIQVTTDDQGNFVWANDLLVYDTNGNGILESSEGQIVAINGVNTVTGLRLDIPLKAVPGATMVTALTTVVAKLVDQGYTLEQANSLLTNAFSISNEVDVNYFDPIAATNNNLANGVETYTAHIQTQMLISQTTALISGASANTAQNVIVNNIVGAIANQIKSGSTLDLTNTQQLKTIILAAGNATGVNLANYADGAASIMAQANQRIENIANTANFNDIEQLFNKVEKVALRQTVKDLKALGKGTKTVAQVVSSNTGNALDNLIANTVLFNNLTTDKSNQGNGSIQGDANNNILIGNERNNTLFGREGDDLLIGVNTLVANPGIGELDNLKGGTGKDTFVLGDGLKTYYKGTGNNRYGESDYAKIQDFSISEGDQIQLTGNQSDYLLVALRGSTNIYLNNGTSAGLDTKDDLIGIVQGVALNFNTNSSSFIFV